MASNKNALLIRSLSNHAQALSCDVAGSHFPIPLRSLAERRRVTSVDFRPLLVDAMLTTHPTGFRIIFNSGDYSPSELQEQFSSESLNRLLPARVRFSLAHEIAHTLFYDLTEGRPRVAKELRSGGGLTSLENLERTCNKLAAQLLMPTPMLKASLRSFKAISPASLLELALRAGVSVEALVHRLSDETSLLYDTYFRGCIVVIREAERETTVVAIARPARLNLAKGLLLIRTGEQWQLTTSEGAIITPNKLPAESTAFLDTEASQGKAKAEYQICSLEVARFDSARTYLLTFEEIEAV